LDSVIDDHRTVVTDRKEQRMNRLWRVAMLVAALCVALASVAVGAGAAKPNADKGKKKPKPAAVRLDPSFGRNGVAKIATPLPPSGTGLGDGVQMAFAPGGRVYALQGLLVLAFEPDGKPARDFGKNGRVKIESAHGEVKPTGLAVDSRGRVLVSGTITLTPFRTDPPIPANAETIGYTSVHEAFVIRYLEDGNLDPTFGSGGEADTTFDLPRPTGQPGKGVEFERPLLEATALTVDPQDRPVVGGTYSSALYFCGYQNEHPVPFVGRLTATGTVDTAFGGKGYVAGGEGRILALARTPEGGVATLSNSRSCGPRSDVLKSVFDALAEGGDQAPALDPTRPTMYTGSTIAVDSEGRTLLIQFGDPYSERPLNLVRLLPSGAVDTSFGFGGGIPLQAPVTYAAAMTVDGKDRTLIAGPGTTLARYTAAGKRDWKFGRKGVVNQGGAGNETTQNTAVATDGRGRIYAAAWVKSSSLKTGFGIQVARFLPGTQ
jgi:uncharacterized delta-60 repeat protein